MSRPPHLDYEAAGAMLAGGMTVKEVAARFGVSTDAVYKARAAHPEKFSPTLTFDERKLLAEIQGLPFDEAEPISYESEAAKLIDELRVSMQALADYLERV